VEGLSRGNDKAALVEVELDSGICIDVLNIRGNKVGDPGINADGGVVDKSSDDFTNEGSFVSRSFDVALRCRWKPTELNREPKFSPCNPFPLEEKGRRIAVVIVKER
jgi:hypothetical protein